MGDDSNALHLETSFAGVVDACRATFWEYWERLLARTAYVAGPERDLGHGLESVSKDMRNEVARFGLHFVTLWTTQTHGGRSWLKTHRMPTLERRARPPREGRGVYSFSNGDEYHGEFRNSVRHGNGVYVGRKNRVHYDGHWVNDKRSGPGMLTIEDHAGKVLYTYDGEWLADARHGSGSCVHKGREKYSGQWVKNLYHGSGSFVDKEGAVYEGDWLEGKFDGVGKHVSKCDTYMGDFKAGHRHGLGQLLRRCPVEVKGSVFGPESLYAGQWREGMRHFNGKSMCSRAEYDGQWVNGMRHGQGLFSSEGYTLEGPWSRDLPDEAGVHLLFYPDGSKYTGMLKCRAVFDSTGELICDGVGDAEGGAPGMWWLVPHGRGIMKGCDGQLFDGIYRDGQPHGTGFEFGVDRAKYTGEFVSGQRHGDGMLAPQGEESFSVHYNHGVLITPTLTPTETETTACIDEPQEEPPKDAPVPTSIGDEVESTTTKLLPPLAGLKTINPASEMQAGSSGTTPAPSP